MFVLIDCNNFYASCEQVFQPKLARKPLLILSNNDGCVIARSQKAKEIGIEMGAPAFQFKDAIERGDVAALSSNFTLYADISRRVMAVLETFSPEMEIYSIDEAFFKVREIAGLRSQAVEIREKVKKWTGIPITIGIAKTKTLAKLANRIAKKKEMHEGVYLLTDPEDIKEMLKISALDDIWGIGRALTQRLKAKNIHTAAQLASLDDQVIRKLLGINGYRTVLELRGTPCIELESAEKRQSIVCSRSFPEPIRLLSLLEEAVSAFAVRASEKLRNQKSAASFLSVSIQSSPFRDSFVSASSHVQFPRPTSFTPDLIKAAKQGLSQIFRSGVDYKKAAVLLADFSDEGVVQEDLLTKEVRSEKKESAMKVLDAINQRYDKAALKFLAEGVEQTWKSRRIHASPRYTTSWDELLQIKN